MTFEEKYQAIFDRDPGFEGLFYYLCKKTTGILPAYVYSQKAQKGKC